VVVDDCVLECLAEVEAAVAIAFDTWRRGPVLLALRTPHESPGGNIAQLLDVEVDHRCRALVLVTTDQFPGADVDM